jgi:lysine 2,3-aminomutase
LTEEIITRYESKSKKDIRQMTTTAKIIKTYEPWEKILSMGVTSPKELSNIPGQDSAGIQKVAESYPMFINPYYLKLLKTKGDPIYGQAVPDIREITKLDGLDDPLNEEGLSPVPGLTHKYPDRALFLISSRCAMYCRFCNRKRKVGHPSMVTKESIKEGIAYIKATKTIRDVLLSGGDPLLLQDNELAHILEKIHSIPHVEIIRIGTRVPCTLPQRVTPKLTKMLKRFHPLYINTHFNHPSEITSEAASACALLADAGIPIGCQTVLLNGINDNPSVIRRLMQKLLTIRVKPYYLFQADLAKGTSHFWTPLEKGLEIMSELQGYTTGLCIPRFIIDLPHGGGKIPVTPSYIKDTAGEKLIIKNYQGKEYIYPIKPH